MQMQLLVGPHPWPHVKVPLSEMKDADPQIGPDAAFWERGYVSESLSLVMRTLWGWLPPGSELRESK